MNIYDDHQLTVEYHTPSTEKKKDLVALQKTIGN